MNLNSFANAFPIKYRIGNKVDLFKNCFPGMPISKSDLGGIILNDLVLIHYECQDDIKYFRVRYFDYQVAEGRLLTVFNKESYYLRERDEEKMLDDMRFHFARNNKTVQKFNATEELKKFKEGIDDYYDE